jgi:FtsP/CotA-like multicopper oxidase with cupredoxin domain
MNNWPSCGGNLLSRRAVLAGAAGLLTLPTWRDVRASSHAELQIIRRTLEVKGKAASVYGIEGPGGKPGLRLEPGQAFRVRLYNQSDVPSVIHWHGQTPPHGQDGVAHLSQDPVPPGGSHDYDFENVRTGTHWMHSHIGLQEQQMMAAPLVVLSREDLATDVLDHTVILHDFTFRDPEEILAELKGGGGAHAAHAMDHSKMDHSQPMPAMGAMLNDVVYDAYLANDRTLDDPEVVRAEPGGRVRLRVINAAAASNLWVELGELDGTLIAVDGNAIEPVGGKRFPLAIAQRADILIDLPKSAGAYPVLFAPEGVAQRTGIVIAAGSARIEKISGEGEVSPAVDLALEASLRAVKGLTPDPVSRVEMLMLTGGDANYVWGLNGKPSVHDTLFSVKPGERIEVMMHNMTQMAHPMHLHGHHFQVTAIGAKRFNGAMRDTVLVPIGETVSIVFDADNAGTWPFHCHHVYHMNSGMMGTVAYSNAA